MPSRRGLSWFQVQRYVQPPTTTLSPHIHLENSVMIGSQNSHVCLPHPHLNKSPQNTLFLSFLVPCVAYIDDKTSPVILFTSHGTQPQCALRSFYSHRFYVKLHPANHDGIPPQQYSSSKLPSPFVSRGLSSVLPLIHHSRRPSAYQSRSMAAHSAPYNAT